VDWDARRQALAELRTGAAPTVATEKLYVTWKTLGLRAAYEEAFAGSYEPLDLGEGAVAFTRGGEVLVAAGLDPDVDPVAPEGWRDVLAVPGLVLATRE
jgi:maltooligosyltrehalose synthase